MYVDHIASFILAIRPRFEPRRIVLARAARENLRISSLTSSLLPITIFTFFLGTLTTEPEASREPTSVPEQRYSTKSSSSRVVSKAILSFATLTKITGMSGQSLRNLIHAKSSLQDRNSAMMKSTLAL